MFYFSFNENKNSVMKVLT